MRSHHLFAFGIWRWNEKEKKKEKGEKEKKKKWVYSLRSTNLDCRHVGCGKLKTNESVPKWRKQEESNIEESNEKASKLRL